MSVSRTTRARDLVVAPISQRDAVRIVRMFHYSRSVVRNSQLHLGVFIAGRLEGAMQFGPPLDKRKVHTLVRDTPWNGMLELNRMAFGPRLPRNSESRALGYALRWLRRTQGHLQWVLSYADGAQCGDGAIYRATGFALTSIRRNTAIWSDGAGRTVNRVTLTGNPDERTAGGASMRAVREAGGAPLPGYQLRYVFFLDPSARERLTVPVLPYSAVTAAGARMYLGKPIRE